MTGRKPTLLRFRQVRPGLFTTDPCAAPDCDAAGVVRVSLPRTDRVTDRAAYTCHGHAPVTPPARKTTSDA